MSNATMDTSTRLAQHRTQLAAERTLFAVVRTGFATAAGGPVIVKVLGEGWPKWLSLTLAGALVVVGYTMLLIGLVRFRALAAEFEGDKIGLNLIPPRLMGFLTVLIMVVVAVTFVAFLVSLIEG